MYCDVHHRYYQRIKKPVEGQTDYYTYHCPHCKKEIPAPSSYNYSSKKKKLSFAPRLGYFETYKWALNQRKVEKRRMIEGEEQEAKREREAYQQLQLEMQYDLREENINRLTILCGKMSQDERAKDIILYTKNSIPFFVQQPVDIEWTNRNSLLLTFEAFTVEVFEQFIKVDSHVKSIKDEVIDFSSDDKVMVDKVNYLADLVASYK